MSLVISNISGCLCRMVFRFICFAILLECQHPYHMSIRIQTTFLHDPFEHKKDVRIQMYTYHGLTICVSQTRVKNLASIAVYAKISGKEPE